MVNTMEKSFIIVVVHYLVLIRNKSATILLFPKDSWIAAVTLIAAAATHSTVNETGNVPPILFTCGVTY